MTPQRHTTSNRLRAVLAVTVAAVSATACGGDDTDTTDVDTDVDAAADDATDAIDDDDLGADIDDAIDDVEAAVEDATGAVADAIEELGEDTVELAARNLASTNAEEEFSDAGYPIDGGLTCTADATDDLTAVELDCTGTTADGAAASMIGTTTELPGGSVTELEGEFVGFVDDAEVFRTDALG